MNLDEYKRWNYIVKGLIATAAFVLAMVGCQSIQPPQAPDTAHKDDKRLIWNRTSDYWKGPEKGTEEVSDPVAELQERDRQRAFREGRATMLMAIKHACDTNQEFRINGYRYGCMPLRIGGGNAKDFTIAGE